jgi:hypothetical protein
VNRRYGLDAGQPPAGNVVSTEAEDIVEIRYPATTGEESLASAVVRSLVSELAKAL